MKKQLDDKCDKCIARDKAEAYKECIEKARNMLWQMKTKYLQQGNTEYASALVIAHTKLDNLLKELVGDKL